MSGWIMPEPLAMPVTTAWPARALASLGTVSVVMMARATVARSAGPAPPRPLTASWPRWARMRSIG